MSERVLVAGGAGFLGSHLCDALIGCGDNVLCLDNFITGSDKNICHLKSNPNFKLQKHDVSSPFHTEVDKIYNLACAASPVSYQKIPIDTLKTCVFGAANLLDLARDTNARILLASSSEVYGDPQEHPQRESYWGNVNPIGPRGCYDEGKRCAETLFVDYHRQWNVGIKIARIFNTYGPRMAVNDGRVVSNFIVQALSGNDLTVYGDGCQTRSFCYVSDMIDGLLRLMNSNDQLNGPMNMGSSHEIEIGELAELIISLCGGQSRIVYRSLPENDPVRRCPDITLAGECLNWQPKVTLRDGLQETINYFRKMLR